MAKFALVRLAAVLAICALAASLLYFVGDKTVLGLAAVASATIAVPVMLTGSLLWGPRGLAARVKGQGTYTFKSMPPTLVLGLAFIAVGLIAYAHFAFSPTAGVIGCLLAVFAAERRILKSEFEQSDSNS